jgi:hypothetical protein
VVVVAVLATIPGFILALRGTPGFDINGWLGTVATFGFLVAYILVCIAAPLYLRARGQLTVSSVGVSCGAQAVILIAFAGSLYPIPPAPYSWLPYVFALCLAAGIASSLIFRNRAVRRAVTVPYLPTESDFA